ncbi:hypothetical protein [Microbispora sp. NPDC049125]
MSPWVDLTVGNETFESNRERPSVRPSTGFPMETDRVKAGSG